MRKGAGPSRPAPDWLQATGLAALALFPALLGLLPAAFLGGSLLGLLPALLRRSRFLRDFLGFLSRFLRSGFLGGCLLHGSLFRWSRFLPRSLSRLFGSR